MGRKPKCTVEEKVSAVEDYLNGIRSVSEIMVDLSIKSTRTIRDWILAYQNGGIEALCPVTANHSYSKEFKIEMVQRYIDGEDRLPIYAPDMEFPHMLHYKTGFRCIMPIENLGIMIPRGRSIWQKHEERQRWPNVKKLPNTVLPITGIIKEQLLCMMFLIARCIHGSENMILLGKMVCPINAGTAKRMMKSMNWSGCAGRTCG